MHIPLWILLMNKSSHEAILSAEFEQLVQLLVQITKRKEKDLLMITSLTMWLMNQHTRDVTCHNHIKGCAFVLLVCFFLAVNPGRLLWTNYFLFSSFYFLFFSLFFYIFSPEKMETGTVWLNMCWIYNEIKWNQMKLCFSVRSGVINWVTQGLTKVLPQPDDKYRETEKDEEHTEVRKQNQRIFGVSFSYERIISVQHVYL